MCRSYLSILKFREVAENEFLNNSFTHNNNDNNNNQFMYWVFSGGV